MKYMHLVSTLGVTALAGCATLTRTDRYLLQDHNVPPPLYARMTHREPLSLTDIIDLSQRQLAPGFIVNYLRSTYAVYRLSGPDVARLRQAKVSQKVIDYLLATPSMDGPEYYYSYRRPYRYGVYPCDYYDAPVIVVAPYRHRYWW